MRTGFSLFIGSLSQLRVSGYETCLLSVRKGLFIACQEGTAMRRACCLAASVSPVRSALHSAASACASWGSAGEAFKECFTWVHRFLLFIGSFLLLLFSQPVWPAYCPPDQGPAARLVTPLTHLRSV